MNVVPQSNPFPIASGGSLPPPYSVPLVECLEARLMADRRVRRFGVNHNAAVYERLLGQREVVLLTRWVELESGPVTIVIAPQSAYADHHTRRCIRQLKLYGSSNYRVIEVTEAAVRREPMLENALAITGCRSVPVFVGDRVRMLTYLVEQGGSASLSDCASFMGGGSDPIASVLALIPKKAVWVELREPIGPHTQVHIEPRRYH